MWKRAYVWEQHKGVDIAGATGKTYTLQREDIAKKITVEVVPSYKGVAKNNGALTSAPTVAVADTDLNMLNNKEEYTYKYYGLKKGSTKAEIKKVYRNLSLILHPDKSGKTEDFVEMRNFFEPLLK